MGGRGGIGLLVVQAYDYLHKDQVYGMPAINVVGLYNLYLETSRSSKLLGQCIEPGESKQVDPSILSLVLSVLWLPKPCL